MMKNKLRRQILLSILLALFGFISALSFPAFSVERVASNSPPGNPLTLAREGRESYDNGNFSVAIARWQEAAAAYEKIGDRTGAMKSLINKSQAEQILGFNPRACQTLFAALFPQENFDCRELSEDPSGDTGEELRLAIAQFEQQPESLTLTQAIGLRGLGNVLGRLDALELSKQALNLSLTVAEKSQSTADIGAALLSLGNTERTLGNRNLNQMDYIAISKIIRKPQAEVIEALEEALGKYDSAVNYYQRATAEELAPTITKLQAKINYLNLLLDIKEWWDKETQKRIFSWLGPDYQDFRERGNAFQDALDSYLIGEAWEVFAAMSSDYENLSSSREAIYSKISLAESLIKLKKIDISPTSAWQQQFGSSISLTQIEGILTDALEEAGTMEDSRAQAYCLGYLGQIYELEALNSASSTRSQNSLLATATDNTLTAVQLADSDRINSWFTEAAYLWKSQLGRLYREREQLASAAAKPELRKEAIAAYATAINSLEALRQDLATNSRELRLDFQQDVRPVYQELIDLLLDKNLQPDEFKNLTFILGSPSQTQSQNAQKSVAPVEVALKLIESLQSAELEFFFETPCLPDKEEFVLETFDRQAAAIYPIILKDRLEVILSLPAKDEDSGAKVIHKAFAIKEEEVRDAIEKFSNLLYNEDVNYSATKVYSRLNLRETNPTIQIDEETLQFLKEAYNWLIEPFETELESQEIETLAFVLTGSLQRIPMAALYHDGEYLLEKYSIALIPSFQLLDPKPSNKPLTVLAAGLSEIPPESSLRGTRKLPEVKTELNQIEEIVTRAAQKNRNDSRIKQLLNQDFTSKTLEKGIQDRPFFSIVHLATHGKFSSNPDKTFILASDKEINVKDFGQLFSSDSNPEIELLVLSACQTATGDERAVLGLAGLAVESARSTVAALWNVGDDSTPIVMKKFYQELAEGKVNKAEALRLAQLELLKNPKYSHPVYWAPYVLVNDWRGFAE